MSAGTKTVVALRVNADVTATPHTRLALYKFRIIIIIIIIKIIIIIAADSTFRRFSIRGPLYKQFLEREKTYEKVHKIWWKETRTRQKLILRFYNNW